MLVSSLLTLEMRKCHDLLLFIYFKKDSLQVGVSSLLRRKDCDTILKYIYWFCV